MINLRDYQEDMIARTRAALKQHHRVILQAPTGAGKTAVACYMMAQARARGLRSVFMVHQNELLKQTARSLWSNKIEHGLIAAGRAKTPLPVQLASVMTLKNRLHHYPEPDLVIVDEAHRALGNSYQTILNHWPNAKVVGLTATPQRTDGKGLNHIFNDIVLGPSIRFLIDQGYLCDYELFGTPVLGNTDNIKTRAGDYDAGQAERELNKPKITGDAVEHYKRLVNGKLMVVMCTTVKHADDVAKAYNDAGVPARSLHGQSQNRDEILTDFENGKFQVLASVNLMIEGVDVPQISAVQWLRPTQSIVVYMQGNGRGLRTHPNKDRLVILDHVGNWQRHGLPDDDREWELTGRKKRKRGSNENLSVQVCDKCHFTFRSGLRECPYCGAPVEFKPRELQTIDGELERIQKAAEAERKARRRNQGQARTIQELVEIGVRREFKNPAFWAATVYASRQKRKPAAAEISAAREHMRALRA